MHAFKPTGELRWSVDMNGAVQQSAPALDQRGILYASSFGGTLAALNASTGELLWGFQTNAGSYFAPTPVIAPDGSVIVASPDGRVTSLNSVGSVLWIYNGSHGTAPVGAQEERGYIHAPAMPFPLPPSPLVQSTRHRRSSPRLHTALCGPTPSPFLAP